MMSKLLTKEQLSHYQEHGFLYPIRVLPATETAALMTDYQRIVAGQKGSLNAFQVQKTYLLQRWADSLVHNPLILDAIEDLMGPNIFCYMTNLFVKKASSQQFVSMHQDATYWGVETSDVVTAWVALSPSTKDSGCMKVQPGSHRSDYQHTNVYAKENLLTRGQTIEEEQLDQADQIYMELEPGQMSLHNFRIVHGSGRNNCDYDRIGLAIRYVDADAKKLGRQESALRVRGEAKGHFIPETRLTELTPKQVLLQHNRSLRYQLYNIFNPLPEDSFQDRLHLLVKKLGALALSFLRQLGIQVGIINK